jgi:hypothetical protein
MTTVSKMRSGVKGAKRGRGVVSQIRRRAGRQQVPSRRMAGARPGFDCLEGSLVVRIAGGRGVGGRRLACRWVDVVGIWADRSLAGPAQRGKCGRTPNGKGAAAAVFSGQIAVPASHCETRRRQFVAATRLKEVEICFDGNRGRRIIFRFPAVPSSLVRIAVAGCVTRGRASRLKSHLVSG